MPAISIRHSRNVQDLPVEVLADTFSLLLIRELIIVSQVSKLFRLICQDPLLNPWRPVILRILQSVSEEPLSSLSSICELSVVPRSNFVDILALAPPAFLLLEATLPTMARAQWEEVIHRRFLPSWENSRFPHPREQYIRHVDAVSPAASC